MHVHVHRQMCTYMSPTAKLTVKNIQHTQRCITKVNHLTRVSKDTHVQPRTHTHRQTAGHGPANTSELPRLTK